MQEYRTDFRNVGEIFEANDRVRARLVDLVKDISDDNAARLTEKGDWTVAHIVEHLALVEEGMAKVAGHLLKKADEAGEVSDGSASLSANLTGKLEEWKTIKGEAPDMVRPTGTKSIAESLAVLEENRRRLNGLREMFERVEGTELTFPHPLFGPLTAQDWLALVGGHESRHVAQIERILSK
ncbi:MAG TPA: DinB family protein [Aridibacter sp.]|nr:DinB family protein [Aridibacter sp.]